MQSTPPPDQYVLSYLTIRKLIGICGMLLPIALILGSTLGGGCLEIKDSISHYYYTSMGDVLVGLLSATAIFLVTYKGYDNDNLYTNLAGAFALCIAYLPTSNIEGGVCAIFDLPENPIRENAHLASAALFFLVLAYISFFLFVKSKGEMTPWKKKRNLVYRACGIAMVLMIVLIAAYFWIFPESWQASLKPYKPVFWLEAIALWAFGISWLVKGETILKDKP
jgi:hypothetical protein